MLNKEENAIVLDYLSRGYSSSYQGEPLAQALGRSFFSLLELVPREGMVLKLRQEIYIGPEERKEIKYIKGKIEYSKLTSTAKAELSDAVKKIISGNEKRYVDFFNKAGPITLRKHQVELLPSIGKKHMWDILEQREKKPFESFEDLTERVHLMPDPARVLTERVLEEIKGTPKYYLFVKPPPSLVTQRRA
jgi:putative nucleotide binding protein